MLDGGICRQAQRRSLEKPTRTTKPLQFRKTRISETEKNYPELVDDFFGRQWVKEFCGDTVAKTLDTWLDAHNR